MLNGVHIVDFANHRDTRLSLGSFTALVGQNGSGKTSFLRAITRINEVRRIGHRLGSIRVSGETDARRESKCAYFATGWPYTWNGIQGNMGLQFSVAADNRMVTPTWLWSNIPPSGAGNWFPQAVSPENLSFAGNIEPGRPGQTGIISNPIFSKPGVFRFTQPPTLAASLKKCRYIKISGSSLRNPAIGDEEEPSLNEDASNLAWVLSYLITTEPERFAQIIASLRSIVPVVERVRSRPIRLNRIEQTSIKLDNQERSFDQERAIMGQELLFDMRSGKGLPASAVSEGTLITLAVLTLLHSDNAKLVLIDDLEAGLHPQAQRDLVKQLRSVQSANPELQLVVSTHSPYVIDGLNPEQVVLFAPDLNGCSVSRRLSEHPDAERAMSVLSTGEFWSAEGEGWVLQGADSGIRKN